MFSGIDTSKDFFDATVITGDKTLLQERYPNGKTGFETFLKAVRGCKLVVIEATGPYYLPLAIFLFRNNVPVSVVNPLVIKRFAQMKMSRAKTDKKDSLLIAQYGQIHQPERWEAPSETIIRIQQLDTYLEGLEKRKRMALNQLHAFNSTGQIDTQLTKEIEEEIAVYNIKIKKVEKQIDELIAKEHKDMLEQLKSIPGIGSKSAYLMIICTNGFKSFKNYRQVISYFGLAPRIYESGTSVKGKSKICKMGMSKVRKTLYMAAGSAIKYNQACKALYERLRAKGKSHKLAVIAAVNKLIKQAFSIVKNETMYNAQFYKMQ
jgi:transposase